MCVFLSNAPDYPLMFYPNTRLGFTLRFLGLQLEQALQLERGEAARSEDPSAQGLLQQNIELRRRLEEEHSGYKRKLQAYQEGQQRQAQLVQKLQAKVRSTRHSNKRHKPLIKLKVLQIYMLMLMYFVIHCCSTYFSYLILQSKESVVIYIIYGVSLAHALRFLLHRSLLYQLNRQSIARCECFLVRLESTRLLAPFKERLH